MPEPIFTKLGMYTTVNEPTSTAYFINPFHQSVCLYVYPPIVAKQHIRKNPIVARQRFGKNVTVATNTQATRELLDANEQYKSGSG
jgi:hypothetical protein